MLSIHGKLDISKLLLASASWIFCNNQSAAIPPSTDTTTLTCNLNLSSAGNSWKFYLNNAEPIVPNTIFENTLCCLQVCNSKSLINSCLSVPYGVKLETLRLMFLLLLAS